MFDEEDRIVEGALTLRKSDWVGDWYCVERLKHAGREWLEKTGPNSFALQCSSRISDADIEGTGFEMLALASAIEKGESESFKRCAAIKCDQGYRLHSPRNSMRSAVVSLESAQALAKVIRETVVPVEEES